MGSATCGCATRRPALCWHSSTGEWPLDTVLCAVTCTTALPASAQSAPATVTTKEPPGTASVLLGWQCPGWGTLHGRRCCLLVPARKSCKARAVHPCWLSAGCRSTEAPARWAAEAIQTDPPWCPEPPTMRQGSSHPACEDSAALLPHPISTPVTLQKIKPTAQKRMFSRWKTCSLERKIP